MKITIEADSVDELQAILQRLLQERQVIGREKPTIANLKLLVRTQNCLRAANIQTVDQLIKFTGPELQKIPNFGIHSRNDVSDALARFGLALASERASPEERAKMEAEHGI